MWVLSPYILIDKALESKDDPLAGSLNHVIVLKIITDLYTNSAIETDEFNHYCERLSQAMYRNQARYAA